MDHAEALGAHARSPPRNPVGLDRLVAGDTAEAAAIAGHLAGCEILCRGAAALLRRVAGLARVVIAEAPDPELKERTLAFVRTVGRDRSAPASMPQSGEGPASAPSSESAAGDPPRPVLQATPRRPGWPSRGSRRR